MALIDLNANHIAAQAGAFEPQRGNNGVLRLFGLPGDTPQAKGQNVTVLSLQGFGLPNVTVEATETMFLNEKRKVAGTVNFDDIEVTFKDFCDQNTAQILKSWHEQVYDPSTGSIGLARNYKKNGIIELFAPNGSYSRYYYLEGVWPTLYNPGTIDMTSAEPVLITMTLSIDKAYAAQLPGPANLVSIL